MSSRLFLFLALGFSLVFVWLASGIFYPRGLYVFVAGVVLLVAALLAYRRGHPRFLFLCYKVIFLLAVTGGLQELVLWTMPGLLTGQAANKTYTGYAVAAEGIYEHHRHLGYDLRPNCSRLMYWNGHWWHHDTNRDRYRGQAVSRADAVFLGDSMIYGHGLETDETVSSRFASRTGTKVANLGQQGTCLVQMWMRFRQLRSQLQPRYVFVCSHFNDVDDACSWYPVEELHQYLAKEDYLPVSRRCYWPKANHHPVRVWNHYVHVPTRTGRLLHFLAFRLHDVLVSGNWPRRGTETRDEECFVPSPARRQAPFAPWEHSSQEQRLGWNVHVRSLQKLKQLCAEQGAQIVLFDLGYPHAFSHAIEEQARLLEVPYVPAGQAVLSQALAGKPVYLANDGHWTPLGSDLVARELAGWWRRNQ
jgi:hypothetical protein